jgi:hypothetical protein
MATKIESPIKEKDSYYVLRHKPTRLYVHEDDSAWGTYDLEETSLLDNTDNQLYFGPMRIYPSVGDRAVSALAMPPGTESDVAQQLDQEARRVIDWLNQNDHYVAGGDPKCDYEYSDFELLLVEIEYSVKDTRSVAAIV